MSQSAKSLVGFCRVLL